MAAEIEPQNYLALLESGEYSDFIIECKGIEFKVHRAIVCSRSSMLRKASSGPFKEAEEGRINLTEEDPIILSHVLVFLYTNDYSPINAPESLPGAVASDKYQSLMAQVADVLFWPENDLEVHALVFKYADMLGIEPLKRLAASRFLADAGSVYTTPKFAKPLRVMYESTRSDDQYLRLPITEICVSNHTELTTCTETINIIIEHEPMAWKVGVKVLETAFLIEQTKLKKAETEKAEAVNAILTQVNKAESCHSLRHLGKSTPRLTGVYKLRQNGTVVAYCDTECANHRGFS